MSVDTPSRITKRRNRLFGPHALSIALVAGLLAACGGETADETMSDEAAAPEPIAVQDSTARVIVIEGLMGPEAVKYDPDQDVYFIANFGEGGGGERDGDGFIARASAEGAIDSMRFMVGSDLAPFHAPRGMYLVGDALWVADIDGIHAFDRTTGAHLDFVDLSGFDPSFLNDVAATPDGTLYVTDTGGQRIFRIQNGEADIAIEDLDQSMNGITWDAMNGRMILGAWNEPDMLPAWVPGSPELMEAGRSEVGGRYDGVEMLDGWIVVGSQRDNTIHIFDGGVGRPVISTPGRPADIAVDTQRRRVAVPYIALDRVDIWDLPAGM